MVEQNSDHDTADWFLARATDFMHGAATLCREKQQGWLPSSALLIAQSVELLAKRRLLLSGITEQELRIPPYGHDLRHLCGDATGFRDEARQIAQQLLQNPSPSGVDEGFDFDLHFDTLADAHSKATDYSLRYHQGVRNFADPTAMAVIVNELIRRERAR